MAKKNPIVDGYLEKVSAGLLQKYQDVITDAIQGQQGIYALYKSQNLYYVGLAGDLKRRLKQHLDDRHKGQWTHFSLYIIRKTEHIKELESLLLRIAYPKGNTVKGKLKNAENLLPDIERRLKEKFQRELRAMFKGPSARMKKKATPEKATASKAAAKKSGKRPRPLLPLLQAGKLNKWQRLYVTYKGKDFKARVRPNGEIERLDTNERFNSASAAGTSVTGRPTNGYDFWKVKTPDGKLIKLGELRG